jgi:glycosyl transferase family 2
LPLARRLRNLRRLYADLWSLRAELRTVGEKQEQLLRAIEAVQDREPESRERVRHLRSAPDYARAFTDPDPLVSVTIPTWTNTSALLDIALPSVLVQTHTNIEVVVVGDASPPEVEQAVLSSGDPRVRFANLPYRGPYPREPRRRWYAAGIPAINEAARLARGSWIAPQNDDDRFTPDHVERLLAAARDTRSEVAYGRFELTAPGHPPSTRGVFPPVMGEFTWQAGIYHAGLRFFEMELGDPWFDRPGDWSLCRRMLIAGVRMTMVDEIVAHLHQSGGGRVEAEEGL